MINLEAFAPVAEMQTLGGFADALLDARTPVPAGLTTWNGSDPGARFDVYRNNVVTSLTQALADTFPAVAAMVGPAFFRTLAHHFVQQHPPRSPALFEYGEGLASFIVGYRPAQSLPYLADLARLEWARVESYHAADALALSHDAWSALLTAPPPRLERSHALLHPAVRLLPSRHAIVSLWAAHQGLRAWEAIDPSAPEAALISRCDDEVHVTEIPQATAVWIESVASGASLGQATADTANAYPSGAGRFDLQAALQTVITLGVFTGFDSTEDHP